MIAVEQPGPAIAGGGRGLAALVVPVESPIPPWSGGQSRLWSLEEMMRFFLMNFFAVIRWLDEEVRHSTYCPDGSLRDHGERVPETECERIRERVKWALIECNGICILQNDFVFSQTLELLRKGCNFESLNLQLTDLRGSILHELSAQGFAFIPATKGKYFEPKELFGRAVHRAFKSAREDIKAAGNCFAAGLHTAAVFHLMRTAEHGMRALARKLRVRLTDKKKPQPIEYAVWEKVIDGCRVKIAAAHRMARGPRREAQLELYAEVADHCTFMKDIWRNNVAHARGVYIESEAQAVMDRVRDFMVFTARVL